MRSMAASTSPDPDVTSPDPDVTSPDPPDVASPDPLDVASPDADLPAPRSGAAGISSGGVAALAGASVAPADAPATYSENGRDRPARQAPALRVSWSEEPSRRARMLARFVRLFVRPRL